MAYTCSSDENNFINFCDGQEITNGQQVTTGSCNGIPMGRIPAVSNMISAIITNPQSGSQVPSDQTFNISVQTMNLNAGNFVNPTTNYYTAPQDLDDAGNIIGHCHVTVQDIGTLDSTTPPDPTTFAFFKGIDDAGNGQGLLQAVIEGGLPSGTYRVCTMIAAQNHQPVAMPVAQRGAQDDCNKFEVVARAGSGPSTSDNRDKDMSQNQEAEGFVVAGDGVNDNEGQGDVDQSGPGPEDRDGQGQQNQGALDQQDQNSQFQQGQQNQDGQGQQGQSGQGNQNGQRQQDQGDQRQQNKV